MKLSKLYNCKRLKIVTPDDKTFTGTMVDYFSGYEEDGYIRTFFKPDDGEAYWREEHERN